MIEGQKQDEKPQGQREGKPQDKNNSVKLDDLQKAVNMFDIFIQRDYSNVTLRIPQKGTIYSLNYL